VDTLIGTYVVRVDGTITTAGKVGALDSADIIGWNLSLIMRLNGNIEGTATLTDSNSFVRYVDFDSMRPLTATRTALFWDFGFLRTLLRRAPGSVPSVDYLHRTFAIWVEITEPRFGIQQIETAMPLPAALTLFATGLGALGLLGWRRKRKQTA